MYPRIRDLREDRDMNQTQIAKMLGMSQTGYSKYETGENDIPTGILIKLADFYNTSIDYLITPTVISNAQTGCLSEGAIRHGCRISPVAFLTPRLGGVIRKTNIRNRRENSSPTLMFHKYNFTGMRT